MKLKIEHFLLALPLVVLLSTQAFSKNECGDCGIYTCHSYNDISKKNYEGASLISIAIAAKYAFHYCRRSEQSPSNCKLPDPNECSYSSRENTHQKNFDLKK